MPTNDNVDVDEDACSRCKQRTGPRFFVYRFKPAHWRRGDDELVLTFCDICHRILAGVIVQFANGKLP